MLFETVLSVALFLSAAVVGMKLFRSKIYNVMIAHLTSQWYGEVLALIGKNKKILDVGIGTGQALIKNKSILIQNDISVDGVDYDLDYVNECRNRIISEKLQNYVSVCHQSIFDFNGGPYDAIYFSASLMILPDPVKALTHAKSMLHKNGKIFVTQTIETKRSRLVKLVEPLLKYVLTIDFGNVTYEDDLLAAFKEANLNVETNKSISGTSVSDARSYRLFVLASV